MDAPAKIPLESAKPASRVIEYTRYDPEYAPLPFGLHNTGVICWFNSTLQFILSISSLNQTILEFEGKLNPFAACYRELLSKLLPTDISSSNVTEIQSLGWAAEYSRKLLLLLVEGKKNSRLITGQQCADEGYTEVIDSFEQIIIENLFTNVYLNVIVCPQCKKVVSSLRDKAIRIGVPTHQTFQTESEFKYWLANHITYVDYKCENCPITNRNIKRVNQLKTLREVIVLTFDMFDRRSKVWYPDSVSFQSTPETGGGVLKYELVAKIEWSGSTHPSGASSGHYWANCKRNGKWYDLNDSSVREGRSGYDRTYMVAYHLA